jgi:hypothetical protein
MARVEWLHRGAETRYATDMGFSESRRMRAGWVVGLLALSSTLSGCAHSPPPRAANGVEPARDEVQEVIRKLAPGLAGCVPSGQRRVQVKLAFDGKAGRIVQVDVLPETRVVCEGEGCKRLAEGEDTDEAHMDLTILECVRHAALGKPAPHFTGGRFFVSFPAYGQDQKARE